MTFQGPIPKKPAHKRMKPKAGAKPTRDEQRHMDRVASLPCLVSGDRRTVSVHHTHDEAVEGAHNLNRLLNGVPAGFALGVLFRMGKFALVSYSLRAKAWGSERWKHWRAGYAHEQQMEAHNG